MKIDTKVATVEGNATFSKTVKMGVDNANIAHIIKSLTDIYADGYLATAREYISNGVDAMIASMDGVTDSFGVILSRPVEVTLPSRLNPTFTIRDYGTGMSAQVLAEVYPQYGASTKRGTNAEIGGFGLGAKSAFSIVNQFIVTSVKAGKKNVVIFQKGEDGVGEGKFLDETDTTDENGTVVSITLPDPDRLARVFNDSNLLLGFPQSSIVVNGKVSMNSIYNKDIYTQLGSEGWVMNTLVDWEKATKSRLKKGYNEKVILVGPIAYTFSKNQLDKMNYGNKFGLIDDYAIVNLPIASVELTPARDSLIFSDKTRKAIVEGTEKLHMKLMAHIQGKMGNCANRREALDVADSLYQAGFGEMALTFKGEAVPRKLVAAFPEAKNYSTGNGSKNKVRDFTHNVLGSNVIIIHGVTGGEQAQTLNRFRKAYELKHDGVTSTFTLLFTTAKKAKLGKWVSHIVQGVFSPEEFEAKGSEYRKALTLEKRLARGSSTALVNYGSLPVSAMTANRYSLSDRPDISSKYSADVAGYANVVYIQLDPANVGSMAHVFADQTSNKGSDMGTMTALNRAISLVSTHFGVEGSSTVVVRIPANTKLDSFKAVVPHAVSMDVAVAAAAKKLLSVTKFSPETIAIHTAKKSFSRGTDWTVSVMNAKNLDEIQNEAVRTWVEVAGKYGNLSYQTNREVAEFAAYTVTPLFSALFAKFNKKVAAVKHYNLPLLSITANSSIENAADIVEYVNFKFAV